MSPRRVHRVALEGLDRDGLAGLALALRLEPPGAMVVLRSSLRHPPAILPALMLADHLERLLVLLKRLDLNDADTRFVAASVQQVAEQAVAAADPASAVPAMNRLHAILEHLMHERDALLEELRLWAGRHPGSTPNV